MSDVRDSFENRSGEAGKTLSGSCAGQETKAPYPVPAPVPTQPGGEGIFFDFNEGCRVQLPDPGENAWWRIELKDLDTGNILFHQAGLKRDFVRSSKRWFVKFGVSLWKEVSVSGSERQSVLVFDHVFDAQQQDVLINFPVGTLGDTLAWMPYADRFAEKHGANVTCAMSGLIIPLFRDAYPHLRFVTHEEAVAQNLTKNAYASYYLGLFFDDVSCDWQPADFRLVGLHKTAAYILGMEPVEEPAKITFPDAGRPIAEPYVCIAVQASSQCKYWNNPYGWAEVVSWLKAQGYRVVCIDQKVVHGAGIVWNYMPYGVENQTGNRPLAERARWLKHAAFFVGLGSGLSWLAWSAGCPVVMIAGFSHPTTEFHTPYRVINWHACNSCWNDPKERFSHDNFLWCPRHQGTPRQFECTRLITAHQVIGALGRVMQSSSTFPK